MPKNQSIQPCVALNSVLQAVAEATPATINGSMKIIRKPTIPGDVLG